jgi:mono/diheme cytochrome c family protein
MARIWRVAKWVLATLGVLIVALVVFVEVRGRRRFDVAMPAIRASADPAVIARGEFLAQGPAHCSGCHAASLAVFRAMRPGQAVAPQGGVQWHLPFGDFRSANLTSDRATGLGVWTDGEIARAVRHGVGRDGHLLPFMALSVGRFSDADLTAIVSYLRTLAPVRNALPPESPNLLGHALVALALGPSHQGPPLAAVEPGPTAAYGAYLTEVAVCVGCHSPTNASFQTIEPRFSGGDPEPTDDDPSLEYAPPNLTRGGVLSTFNEDGFIARMRAGRRFADSHMPWENFGRMSDDDLRAIWRYLQTVPVSRRVTGPIRRTRGWKP